MQRRQKFCRKGNVFIVHIAIHLVWHKESFATIKKSLSRFKRKMVPHLLKCCYYDFFFPHCVCYSVRIEYNGMDRPTFSTSSNWFFATYSQFGYFLVFVFRYFIPTWTMYTVPVHQHRYTADECLCVCLFVEVGIEWCYELNRWIMYNVYCIRET